MKKRSLYIYTAVRVSILYILVILVTVSQQNVVAQIQNTIVNGVNFNYPLSPYAPTLDYSILVGNTSCGRFASDWINAIEFGISGSGSGLVTITLPNPSTSISFLLGGLDVTNNETVSYFSNNGGGSVTLSASGQGTAGCFAISGNTFMPTQNFSNGQITITSDQLFTQLILSFTGPYNVISTISSTVPVKLISFKGISSNCIATLNWLTGEESNLSNFEILSSADGITFKTIAKILPKGSSSKYNFQTLNPNITFYKLRINDLDGNYMYSSIIKIASDCKSLIKSITPNPVSDQLTILGLQKDEIVQIINESGQVVLTKKEVENNKINVGFLPRGLYIIRLLSYSQQPSILKFLKK